jgi:predicted RNA-binding protein with PUA-like domain
MKYFLAKTEPHEYSIDDLEKDGTASWDGVKNPQAVIFLKAMQPGDKVLIYHSGGESQIVGLAEMVGNSRPDPKEPRSWLVDFKFLKKFATQATLKEVKQSGLFPNFRLVRQSRLSTMDVPEEFVDWLKKKGLDI